MAKRFLVTVVVESFVEVSDTEGTKEAAERARGSIARRLGEKFDGCELEQLYVESVDAE